MKMRKKIKITFTSRINGSILPVFIGEIQTKQKQPIFKIVRTQV